MFELSAEIKIADKVFNRVNHVEVVEDSRALENRAMVKIPTTARMERAGEFVSEVETAKEFKVGDEIEILLGYDGGLQVEFHGYVSKIHPSTPLRIECEDAVYLLKRKNLKASFRKTGLTSLLEYILDGTGIDLAGEPPGISFTHFYLDDVSAAKALQDLRKEYGLTIYFKSINELFVGIASDRDGVEVKYRMGQNVISSNLEWVDEADVKLQIEAVYVLPNNTQVKEPVGDKDGEKRTLFFYDLDDPTDLKRRAEEEIRKYKYSGYRGSIKTFLLPRVKIAQVAQVEDGDFPERDGDYLVEKVTTTFGTNGARRKVELGLKLN